MRRVRQALPCAHGCCGPHVRADVTFPSGEERPSLGLGTWRMGESRRARRAEVAALRLALDIGYRVVDTAEMYGEGGAESVLGQALAEALRGRPGTRRAVRRLEGIAAQRQRAGVLAACEAQPAPAAAGLHRPVPAALARRRAAARDGGGFEKLQRRGLDPPLGRQQLRPRRPARTGDCARRHGLRRQPGLLLAERTRHRVRLAALAALRQMPLMAYSPIDQGELVDHPSLRGVAESLRATTAQVALAWVLRRPGVMAIPKASRAEHLHHNWAAQDLRWTTPIWRRSTACFRHRAASSPLAVR